MLIRKSFRVILPSLLGLAALGLSVTAAGAQEISGLSVTARAPTELRINISGKQPAAVFKAVHVAARTVCRNALTNSELDVGDFGWCRDRSASKAMKRYAALTRPETVAAADRVIVLSAR